MSIVLFIFLIFETRSTGGNADSAKKSSNADDFSAQQESKDSVYITYSGSSSLLSDPTNSPFIPAPSSPPSLDTSLPIRPVTSFTTCGSQNSIITRYSKTSICIEFVNPRTFSSGSTSQLTRALFDPIADSLSSITVQGSYALNNVSLESTLLVVSSNAASSAMSSLTGAIPGGAKFYINEGHIFNLYTIIITVLSGKVTLISLEEGCFFCQHSHDCTANAPDASPYQRSCHLYTNDCIDNGSGGNTCDLRFFIVWQGDDQYESPLTSAGRRPSRFAMYQVAGQQILDQMKHL